VPLLPDAEVVIAVLVDFHAHTLAGLRHPVVQDTIDVNQTAGGF